MILCFSLEAAQAREHRETACTESGDRTKWPTWGSVQPLKEDGLPHTSRRGGIWTQCDG